MANQAIRFFDDQFRRQVQTGDYVLNPFEARALPYLYGRVLDLGCGLGNLAVAAAGRGCTIHALDASMVAIGDLSRRSRALGLAVDAEVADLTHYVPADQYDCVVAISLLMFFTKPIALRLLESIKRAVKPGGLAVVNALIEGTIYVGMFDPDQFCLFGKGELESYFSDWVLFSAQTKDFAGLDDAVKRFSTVIAGKPQC